MISITKYTDEHLNINLCKNAFILLECHYFVFAE